MWSANSGTHRSSWICLLVTYQRASVARWRHLHCNTCSLQTWVRVAEKHTLSIMGQMSYLYSTTSFLMERSILLLRSRPSILEIWAVFYLTWSMWGDQVRRVSRVTPIKRVVSTHWIDSPNVSTGRCWMKGCPTCAKIIAVLFLITNLYSLNYRRRVWGMTPGSWRAAPTFGTWLWWPWRPRRGRARRAAMVWACSWHTD